MTTHHLFAVSGTCIVYVKLHILGCDEQGDTTPDAKQKRKQAKKEAKKKLHATGREYEGGMEKLTWFKLTDAQVSGALINPTVFAS